MNKEDFFKAYTKGKEDTINKIKKFIEQESKFMPDVHVDQLLDRLVKFIKEL